MECSALNKAFLFIVIILVPLAGCNNKGDLGQSPASFPEIAFPERNPLTNDGVKLGEALFFDPVLSIDSTVSCATCHQPEKAFTDGLALSSSGVSGKKLKRNVPTLYNVAWGNSFFWDGGAKDLESQAYGPLLHPDEMGDDLIPVLAKLNRDPEYKKMFLKAFNTDTITSKYLVRALAQYERTLWSTNSKYDQYLKGEVELTDSELLGLQLFNRSCVSCHPPPLFTDHKFHNVGLERNYNSENEGMSLGRYRITHDSSDIGKYKTPTLRNIEITGPYMHDGSIQSLEEAIRLYSEEMIVDELTDPILVEQTKTGKLKFSDQDMDDLVSFLLTLTDSEFK